MKRLVLGLLLAVSALPQTASAGTCQAVIAPWLAQANDANDKEQPAVSLPLFQRSVAACRAADDRAGIATGLLGVGQSLHMLNRYAESEQALLEGWAIRQALDDGDPGRESMYYPSELMYLYRQWSRFDLAWQWGDIALAAKARLIGKDTVSYGTSLSNLSGVALQTKEYARGLPYARQAMETWARTSGEDSTDHAWGMRDVGVLLLRMGRMEEAYGYLERAYRIRLAAFGENRTETQTSVTDMANWYTLSGNDRQALAFAQRALAMAVQRSGADSMQASVALNRLSGIHLRLGESGKAWQEAEDGLRIRRALFGDRHANTVSAWQDVALTALADNQLGRAEVAAAAALEHCRAVYGEAAATCAAHQLAHGGARMALGQYQQALEAAQAAARLAMSGGQALPADEADALLLAAQAQAALGLQDAAETALAGLEARLLQTPPATAGMLDTVRQARLLARAEHAGIGAAELQALAREAGAMAQQLAATRGAAHPAHAQALLDAAGLNARAGDAATARSQSARALAIGMATEQSMLEARAAAQLGALEPDAAGIFLGKQAVNALQATRAGTASLPVPLRQGFVRQKRAAYGQLADRLLDQRRIHEAETVLAMVREDEFHSLVRSAPDPRATRLGYTGAEGEWQRQFEARAAALRAGAQALAAARERQAQGVAQADDAWRRANDAMALLLDGATEALAALPAGSVATPALAGKAGMARAEPLKRGVLHLTYLVTDTRLRIVAQRGGRSGSTIHDVAIDERALAQRIARLRRSAQDPGLDARADAQALYALLLAPASRELDGATSLSLSLGGVLRYLPFAMLHDGRRWLVERLPVSLHGEQAGAQEAPRRAPSLALFGQTRASGELPALPFVQRELRAVQAIGHAARIPSQIYLDGDFTGAALQRALPANSSVHIASHFVLRSGAGADSYLLLGDGGKLSLAELAQDGYRFAGLDLLTLSACETAVPAGTDATGRELEGLAWLARQRGARNVLASLWRVSDQSTATLMGDFYAALAQGKGKPQALRQAQLRQIRAARHAVTATRGLTPLDAAGGSGETRGHPFYWAGFILLGS